MYYLYIIARIIANVFPREMCYAVAKFCAIIKYYVSKKDRAAVFYNLSAVVPDQNKLNNYTKEVFINFSYYLVDFFRYQRLTQEFIKKYVTVHGRHYLEQSFSLKKGVIALTAHLGNYELGGAVTSLLGYPLCAIALSHKDPRINAFFDAQRKMTGMNVIRTGFTGKKGLSVLKEGKILAILGDRDFSGGGLKVEMFSRQVHLPRGMLFFSGKTGAVILPSFFVRDNDRRYYHLIFEKPFVYDCKRVCDSQPGDLFVGHCEEDILRKYVSVLEKYIKQYPQQWYMFQNYWAGSK